MTARNETNKSKLLRLIFRETCATHVIKTRAIRRSGHRGTSCLNWWVNVALWIRSVAEDPVSAFAERGIDGKCKP